MRSSLPTKAPNTVLQRTKFLIDQDAHYFRPINALDYDSIISASEARILRSKMIKYLGITNCGITTV